MTVEEFTHIYISRSNKAKLDNFKLINESYNAVLDELIKFGEENNFKSKRIDNLTKNLRNDNSVNAKTKIKQGAITASTS